jgi:flagellar hook-associated protein 3 FlgL
MRISTAQIYALGSDAIGRAQSALFETQQKIASGQRMLTPSDDPVASAQAIVTTQAKSRVERYGANVTTATETLSLEESVLGDVTDALTEIRTLAVRAGSGSLADADRASLATELEGRLAQLVALANSTGADGSYLFSGFQLHTPPFAKVSGSYIYNGDQGQRELPVADGRDMPISDSGQDLFAAVKTGNGVFAARAAAINAGSGLIDTGSVTNPAALSGHTYRLQFAVAAGVTTYDVLDVTAATTVSAGNAYAPGSAITVAGMQVTVSGAPATGDQFTLAPAGRQSVFATVQNLIATLRTPGGTTAGRTAITNGISVALQDLTHGQDAVLTTRASLGARLQELDSLASSNDERSLQYDATLSQLQDLDYNQALSDFSRQQLALEAAQKSFLQVSGLSLFSMM